MTTPRQWEFGIDVPPALPSVVVTTCAGAGDGALGVVRALGRRGLRLILVSDQSDTPAARSRYCARFLHLPCFTGEDPRIIERLVRLAQDEGPCPVLFPTSDPDLLLVARLESALRSHYHIVSPPAHLVAAFADKRRFHDMATRFGWPTPRTFVHHPGDDVDSWKHSLEFPAIVKPAMPTSWTSRDVLRATGYAKAVIVADAGELLRVCDRLSNLGAESLVQEYVVGPDHEHYDLHALVHPKLGVLGCFTGRKIRIHPPGAGSGCYVESVHVPELVDLGLRVLRDVDYAGLANINFKRDERTGEYILFEVNPRVSSWNILATECGVDLPAIAYAHAAGLHPKPIGRQREGVRYVNLRNDLKTFLKVHRRGELSVQGYVHTLLHRPLVHQTLSLHDPLPSVSEARRSMAGIGSRVKDALARVSKRPSGEDPRVGMPASRSSVPHEEPIEPPTRRGRIWTSAEPSIGPAEPPDESDERFSSSSSTHGSPYA